MLKLKLNRLTNEERFTQEIYDTAEIIFEPEKAYVFRLFRRSILFQIDSRLKQYA